MKVSCKWSTYPCFCTGDCNMLNVSTLHKWSVFEINCHATCSPVLLSSVFFVNFVNFVAYRHTALRIIKRITKSEYCVNCGMYISGHAPSYPAEILCKLWYVYFWARSQLPGR